MNTFIRQYTDRKGKEKIKPNTIIQTGAMPTTERYIEEH